MTPFIAAILGGILCALIAAAFLTPLTFRIPLRISRQWAREVDEYAELELSGDNLAAAPLTRTQSVLLILASALLGCATVATKGLQAEGMALAFYFLSLLLLVAINMKALLLPDIVVLPVLWAGLLYHAQAGSAAEHIYGAAAAYLAPFLLTAALQKRTHRPWRSQNHGHGRRLVRPCEPALVFHGICCGICALDCATPDQRPKNPRPNLQRPCAFGRWVDGGVLQHAHRPFCLMAKKP